MLGQGMDHTYGTKSPVSVFAGVRAIPAPTSASDVSLNLRNAINIGNMPTVMAGYTQTPPVADTRVMRRNMSVPAILPVSFNPLSAFSALGGILKGGS